VSREVVVVSDSLGETAEAVAKAALSQFEEDGLNIRKFAHVDSDLSLAQVREFLTETSQAIVIYTVVLPAVRDQLKTLLHELGILGVDVLGPALQAVATIAPGPPRLQAGLVHMLDEGYFRRVAAVEFAVRYDDGKEPAGCLLADVVILGMGEKQGISGEGFDRSNLDLPGNQEQLLEAVVATGKPVVLVLENGRPLTIGWAKEHVPAILEAWYPGEFGGKAIAETLFGDNNPAGRLTITFPRSTGQLPDFYNSDPSRMEKYVDDNGKPLFPFGFGLSYTTFRYGHLAVEPPAPGSHDDVQVTVEVTNTGSREGDEVAQLYMREDVTSVETPRRSLEGFSRIHLKPQETKTVSFRIPQEQLAVWNVEREWAVEPGTFTLWAGGSSEASLTAKFLLKP
jgi:hypothetical protein